MEYRLKASIRKTMNADRSYTLTGVGTYDFVGSITDVDFMSKVKLVTEIEDVVQLVEVEDSTNTCTLLSSGSLVDEVVE